MARTMVRSKTKAIELAIRDYLEKKAIEDIIALSGKIHIDPNWEREEELELDEYQDRG
jgi:hypothetical protein